MLDLRDEKEQDGLGYVIQVISGTEEDTMEMLRRQISKELLQKCFVYYYENMRKYAGEWHKQKKLLFPGYVFVITGQVDSLYLELKKVKTLTKILGDKDCFIPLSEGEVEFLRGFGGEEQLVGMSVGFIENDKVTITSGPLAGKEGCIRKIDRHKRTAKIQVEMFGQVIDATVGLEIVRKTIVDN
ncbi:MAG: antiterminator LoaP [Lachnospiraceae bacterium]|nr:antiterminator LoaP [Lachnospiraceae bacterium]